MHRGIQRTSGVPHGSAALAEPDDHHSGPSHVTPGSQQVGDTGTGSGRVPTPLPLSFSLRWHISFDTYIHTYEYIEAIISICVCAIVNRTIFGSYISPGIRSGWSGRKLLLCHIVSEITIIANRANSRTYDGFDIVLFSVWKLIFDNILWNEIVIVPLYMFWVLVRCHFGIVLRNQDETVVSFESIASTPYTAPNSWLSHVAQHSND